jgi:hypothetical protein
VKRKFLKEWRSKESGRIRGGEANLAKERSGSVQKKTKQEMKKQKHLSLLIKHTEINLKIARLQ